MWDERKQNMSSRYERCLSIHRSKQILKEMERGTYYKGKIVSPETRFKLALEAQEQGRYFDHPELVKHKRKRRSGTLKNR